jgi:hypothetical protein
VEKFGELLDKLSRGAYKRRPSNGSLNVALQPTFEQDCAQIKRLCAGWPRHFATAAAHFFCAMIGVHIELQHYNKWSSQFLLLMSRPGHAKQRVAFLKMSEYWRMRSSLTLLSAYLFAQSRLVIRHYDGAFAGQQKALEQFNASHQIAATELARMKTAVNQLHVAPGLWSQYASKAEDSLARIHKQFSKIETLPSLKKRERNNKTRTAETWLLRTTVWAAGSEDKRRDLSMRTSWTSLLIRHMCSWILGPRVDLGIQSVLEWVRIAEWASGATDYPREIAALRKIHDEDGERLSTLIDRHRRSFGG